MRRAIILLACWVAAWGAAGAATTYVNGSCTFNGNGNAAACAASGGGTGAWNSLANATSAVTCGSGGVPTTVNIAGGTYSADQVTLSNKACSVGNEIIFQGSGWTAVGAGTQQTVYIEAVRNLIPTDWTKCAWQIGPGNCNCDLAHAGVQIGAGGQTACEQTWWYTKTTDGRVFWAAKPDGSITPVRASTAAMTATYDALPQNRCSVTWATLCASDGDCPGGETCRGTVLTRWGTTVPSGTGVNWSNNGYGFNITNVSGIILRGLQFRRTRRSHLQINAPNTNVSIIDNKFWEAQDGGQGSARPVTTDNSIGLILTDNEFAYSQDEPIHLSSLSSPGVVSGLVARNWVHDVGDPARLGDLQGTFGTLGTPNCTTFSSDAPQAHSAVGDFSGLVVENNLFQRCRAIQNKGICILVESNVDGMIVRDNICQDVGAGIKIAVDYSDGHANNNQFYNNLIIHPTIGGYGVGILIKDGVNLSINGNKFFNNTIINPDGEGIGTDGEVKSAVVNNIFRNNIIFGTGYTGTRLINWPNAGAPAGNSFQNNLLFFSGGVTCSNSIATIGASSFKPRVVGLPPTQQTCSTPWTTTVDVDGDAVADANKWNDPLFVNCSANDLRLLPTSPAIDAGTLTDMPSRTGINNTIADDHGLVDYSEVGITPIAASPDMGIYESLLTDGGFESGAFGVWTDSPTVGCTIHFVRFSSAADLADYHVVNGIYSMRMGWPGFISGACSRIRVALPDLDPTRLYRATGTFWSATTPVNGVVQIAVLGGGTKVACNFAIGDNQNVDFECPFTPLASGSTLQIEAGSGDFFYLDNLAIR